MIVRISRGRIRPGGEAQAFALLRGSVAGTGAHPETIAESFHGFGQIDPASVDLLAPTEPAGAPERRPPSDARPD